MILWFTGLSGAGKTTVARGLQRRLSGDDLSVAVFYGDDIRKQRSTELGFNRTDILKNNDLIVELCAEKRTSFDVILVPIISPYRRSRSIARSRLLPNFFEIYCSVSINCVRKRDTKGLYRKQTEGAIENLIGVSDASPYEQPLTPDLILDTEYQNISSSVEELYRFVSEHLPEKKRIN